MRALKRKELSSIEKVGWKVGQIDDVTFDQLVKALGKPTFKPKHFSDDKVQYEWVVPYEDKIFRIYDWKTFSKTYTKYGLTTWSVGGSNSCNWFLQSLMNKIEQNG